MHPREVVEAVRSVIGDGPHKLHRPEIGKLEQAYVSHCLESGEMAYGPYIKAFEDKLCEIVGRKYCVATCSGTAALHLASLVTWRSPSKVSLPSLTFVATANALKYAGHSPTFSDVGERADVSTGILGGVRVHESAIEDAAPCLGSWAEWHTLRRTGRETTFRNAGTFGKLACFSFNGNKICVAGGGGAVLTDDEDLAREIRHLAGQAKSSATEHDRIGFNYRMPNYNAALGLAQLERLPEFLDRKARLAERYERALGELFWKPPEGSNNWLNAILVDNRDEVVKALNDAGFESRALHAPLHTLPMYRDNPRGDMTRTMDIWNRCVCLPSGAGLA